MIAYLYAGFFALFLLLPLVRALINIYPDYLWFKDLDYQAIFLKIWSVKLLLLGAFTLAAFLFIYLNLLVALRIRRRVEREPELISGSALPFDLSQLGFGKFLDLFVSVRLLPFVLSCALAAVLGGVGLLNWDKVLLFFNAVPFHKTDPIFHQDIGFYFFAFPFYKLIQGWLTSLVLLVLAAVIGLYVTKSVITVRGFTVEIRKEVKAHIAVLLGLFFLLLAWAYHLNMYQMLFSNSSLIYGAGYTDIHAGLIGYKTLMVISLVIVGLLFVSIFRRGILLPIEGVVVLVLVSVLLKGIYPAVLQQLIVKPNEIEKERPYIARHIDYTRDAYHLNSIEEKMFNINPNLSLTDVQKNQDMISNIRLWDHRPLLKTLEQLQEIRLYYNFNDVDVDRYRLNGKYQQVMLSARELDADQLPEQARNWINQKLTYTHGHGLVMLPVNKMTPEGLPTFYLYDIPAKINVPLTMTNPDIYFGEATNKYIIVNTRAKEFDYPQGDNNQYTTYQAKRGIELSSFWRKVLFAIKFQEINILFSSSITPKSRVLFDRNILLRVKKIAPFLQYDRDPYIVLSEGKLYWIIDAYTLSDKYPYAQPFMDGQNYIRNSVKVVVNAYTGDARFYLTDMTDPLVLAYQKVFPNLLRPLSEVSADIRAHFRYPEDFFMVQAMMYSKYHMTDPQVFYNQEDLWVIPTELFDEKVKPMTPYYTIMKLPEDQTLTFRLMLPFTPAKKNNMIGWMSANSDDPNYGKITVYKMPKEQMVYGPTQIESRIDQDTEISKQLTLWGQKGSQVIRGNLLVIPIENTFLYVQPLYLQATQSRFPELKRVIVAYGNRVAMEPTFEMALQKVFELGSGVSFGTTDSDQSLSASQKQQAGTQRVRQLINEANQNYQAAQRAVQDLDWKAYGEYTRKLGAILEELKR